MHSTAKSNIASAITAVPALILSKKIVSEVGLVKGVLPKYYWPIMRQHPVLSAIFYAGLAVQTYYTGKMVVEQVRESRQLQSVVLDIEDGITDDQLMSSIRELLGGFGMSEDEMVEIAAAAQQLSELPVDKMAKYEEHLRLAKENTTPAEQPLSRISPLWYQDRGCSDPEQQITPKVSTERIEVKAPVNVEELHTALLEQVRQAYDEACAMPGPYNAAQGYLADIRGTLWVELDHEVEVAQINSAIRMLNEMKENADDVVSDWGVATATQILFDISGFAVKDMQL